MAVWGSSHSIHRYARSLGLPCGGGGGGGRGGGLLCSVLRCREPPPKPGADGLRETGGGADKGGRVAHHGHRADRTQGVAAHRQVFRGIHG